MFVTVFFCLFSIAFWLCAAVEEGRWLDNGRPNPNYNGPKTSVRAVLSSTVGCPCKKFPGVNDFLNMGMNFKYNMDVRYHPGRPELAFYIDAVQQAPAIDLGRISYDDLLKLLEDAGVEKISIEKRIHVVEESEE